MLRLRRAGEINGEHVPEIILLNSHDGTSSYQMLPGYFRFVCQNGCVCGQSLGEVRVPHRGNVVDRVIEGAYEVVGVFDRIEEKRDAMQSLVLPPPARQALAQAALTYRYGDEPAHKIFYPKPGKKFCVLPRTGASGRGSDAPCGEGSQTGEVHTTGNTAAGSRETSKPRLPKLNG